MKSIFTIGYEGSNIDDFIATLKAAGVEVLADVRDVTVSRKKGFSKNGLRDRLAENGIEYFHAKGLGDPKPGREAARRGDYNEFRRVFGAHMRTDTARSAFGELTKVAEEKLTCLMCFEHDPSTCHRRIVANQLKDYDFKPFDLFVDKKDRYERSRERMPRHNFSQSIAAAE
ncbi:MAG: hypothetical protein CML23_14285 [Rhizobiaceae bacterium]|nr:hypothetical protein [Rhizobiaceae bacterium]